MKVWDKIEGHRLVCRVIIGEGFGFTREELVTALAEKEGKRIEAATVEPGKDGTWVLSGVIRKEFEAEQNAEGSDEVREARQFKAPYEFREIVQSIVVAKQTGKEASSDL